MAFSGVVKNWFSDKGYGFITCASDSSEIFAHCTDIDGCSLLPGGEVTFDVSHADGGKPKAVNISGAIGPRIAAGGKGQDRRDGRKGGGKKGGGGKGGGGHGYSPYPTPPDPSGRHAPQHRQHQYGGEEADGSDLLAGTVKNWFKERGYGFIMSGGEEHFVHHSDIGPGYGLIAGGEVQFRLGQGPSGKPKAVDVSGAICHEAELSDVGTYVGAGGGGLVPHSKGGGKGGKAARARPIELLASADLLVYVPQEFHPGQKLRVRVGDVDYAVDVPPDKGPGSSFVCAVD
eukprot:TRINITY_DN1633_c0_g1_i1.p1 TRINITY_DN1633_c0_g1~~TRINITY_DN1633_c0_g1_i1.p1  ORF type:complete len:288 (+),score=66.49 TRINITY_DN1633_c0_g1_i1:59-922(+)